VSFDIGGVARRDHGGRPRQVPAAALYDDDRQRARSAPAQTRPAAQRAGVGGIVRTRSQGSGS